MNLAARHRPKCFSDVVGQDAAVEFLRQAARVLRGNVLLAGPSGCGKSTLAELYAASLLCDAFDGLERCGECQNCLLYDAGCHPNLREVDFGGPRSELIASEINQDVAAESLSGGWQIYIFDHIDRSQHLALGILRNRFERTPPRTVFIMCAEEQLKLPPWLRESVSNFPIDDVGEAAIQCAIGRVVRAETLEADEDALWLIAERSGGSIRAAIRDLETLASVGPLTLERTQGWYGVPAADTIRSYLDALLTGNLEAQCAAIEMWPGTARTKGRALKDLLWQTYAQARSLSVPSSHSLLSPAELLSYASRLTSRARMFDTNDQAFWADILRDVQEVATNTQLFERVCRLHELLDEAWPAAATTLGHVGNHIHTRPRLFAPKTKTSPASAYLTEFQAKKILTAASFMAQEYGVLFNTRISIRYLDLGIEDPGEGVRFLGALTHELGQITANRKSGLDSMHWAYVHENDARGLRTHIAAHLPLSQAAVREWLTGFTRNQTKLADALAPTCRMRGTGHRDSIGMHASLLRLLCRCLHPDCTVVHPKVGRLAFLDALGVSRHLRPKSEAVGHAQRYRVSKTIGRDAQRRAADAGLWTISAVDASAWDFLLGGWELEEHATRRDTRAKREQLLAELEKSFPASAGKVAETKRRKRLDAMHQSWKKEQQARVEVWRAEWELRSNSK